MIPIQIHLSLMLELKTQTCESCPAKIHLMFLKPPKEKQAEIFSGLSGLFIKSRKGSNFSINIAYKHSYTTKLQVFGADARVTG